MNTPPTSSELDAAIESIDRHAYDVGQVMADMIENLEARAARHDMSKYDEEELPYIAKMMAIVEREGKVAYGTPEYQRRTQMIAPMVDRHRSLNDHHPEFFPDGVDGMSLMSLTEMVADWIAASQERNPDGLVHLAYGFQKYAISPQLQSIIINTLDQLKIGYTVLPNTEE